MDCIATFDTTHMALRFEKSCRAAGLTTVKIVPVPRHLSASCGLACQFPCEAEDQVRSIAREKHVDVMDYHHL